MMRLHCPHCDQWYPYGGDVRSNTKLPCPYCGKDIRRDYRQGQGGSG
jgi:sarcosine oxidase delta subunit